LVNGVEEAATSLTGNILHSNENAAIGNDNSPIRTDSGFIGQMDEVGIFNRALSDRGGSGVEKGVEAPGSRCGGAASSPDDAWSSSRSSGVSDTGGWERVNRPLDPRCLVLPDIVDPALWCRSTDYHPQGNGAIRMSGLMTA
jgi:hypothetical protein